MTVLVFFGLVYVVLQKLIPKLWEALRQFKRTATIFFLNKIFKANVHSYTDVYEIFHGMEVLT